MYWVLLCLSSGTDLQKSRHVLKSLSLCNKVLSYLISLSLFPQCTSKLLHLKLCSQKEMQPSQISAHLPTSAVEANPLTPYTRGNVLQNADLIVDVYCARQKSMFRVKSSGLSLSSCLLNNPLQRKATN